ncbi:hypothetical protein [Streptomyces sp. NPDC001054]
MPNRYIPNPGMYGELARSAGMRRTLLEPAKRGADMTRALAPSYSGPTYDPAVERHGEYRASVFSAASMSPSGWRAEFGATAAWSLQVEFGSGQPATSRARPQGGRSPKARPLGRALDSLRI